MYPELQDVEQERAQFHRENSCLSSVEARLDEKAEDAPHCVTCYCLPSKMKCSRIPQMHERCAELQRTSDYNGGDYTKQRCSNETKPSSLLSKSSSRCDDVEKRLSRRRTATTTTTTTVDDLLRQLKLDESFVDCSKTEEDELAALCPSAEPLHRRRRRHRPSGTGSYRNRHQVEKLVETSARNSSDGGQRWKHDDIHTQHTVTPKPSKLPNNLQCHNNRPLDSTFPQVVSRFDIEIDALTNKHMDGDWQRQRLEDNVPLTAEKDRSQAASEPDEASCNNLLKEFGDEAHVRELKLVRWNFIERIREEVHKLHRLQRHLDSCSPRGPAVPHTRSVYTMTDDEPNGS